MNTKKGIVLPEDYPFMGQVLDQMIQTKIVNRKLASADHTIHRRITMTVEEKIVPTLPWVKLFQHKTLLRGLGPWAAQLMLYVLSELEYNNAKIRLTQGLTCLTKRTYPQAIKELTDKGVISKAERGWYWVNLTVLLMEAVNLSPIPEEEPYRG